MALLSAEEREALMSNPLWGDDTEGADSQPASGVENVEQESPDSSLTTNDNNGNEGAETTDTTASQLTSPTAEKPATAGDNAAVVDGAGVAAAKETGTDKEQWVPRTRLQAVIKQRNERDSKILELERKVAQYEARQNATQETVKFFQNDRAAKLANGGQQASVAGGEEDHLSALERIISGQPQGQTQPQTYQQPQGAGLQQFAGQSPQGTRSDPVQEAMAKMRKDFDDKLAALEQQRLNEIAAQRLDQETREVAQKFDFFKNDANLQALRQTHYIIHEKYQPKNTNDPGPSLMQVAEGYLKDIEIKAKQMGFTKQQVAEAVTTANTQQAAPAPTANATPKQSAPPRAGSSVGATSQPRVPQVKTTGTWKEQARESARAVLEQLGIPD